VSGMINTPLRSPEAITFPSKTKNTVKSHLSRASTAKAWREGPTAGRGRFPPGPRQARADLIPSGPIRPHGCRAPPASGKAWRGVKGAAVTRGGHLVGVQLDRGPGRATVGLGVLGRSRARGSAGICGDLASSQARHDLPGGGGAGAVPLAGLGPPPGCGRPAGLVQGRNADMLQLRRVSTHSTRYPAVAEFCTRVCNGDDRGDLLRPTRSCDYEQRSRPQWWAIFPRSLSSTKRCPAVSASGTLGDRGRWRLW